MSLTFKRKLPKSKSNKAAQITIPRVISESWSEYDSLDLIYENNELRIIPKKRR